LWNDFKCELGNNQFQFGWFDGHSSPSAPTGCSRKRRHSRVGPRLPPSLASPHTPQPCPKDQLVPYAALWQMAASRSPFLYDSINSRIPQYARSAKRAYAAGIIQPFSQKPRTPTVAKEFQIGLYDPAEADLELFCNCWSAGFFGRTAVAGPSCPPDGLLSWLCIACCMDHPARRSWRGERGATGSTSGCLARQRGAGNEARETKASPSWHMLNHGVLLHRCAPVPSPASERSKSALKPAITYVKFIRKLPPHTVTRRDDPLRPFQAESSSHEASHERRKC